MQHQYTAVGNDEHWWAAMEGDLDSNQGITISQFYLTHIFGGGFADSIWRVGDISSWAKSSVRLIVIQYIQHHVYQ
eukprot:scaffold26850_cov78-Attheya_sp.AAC.1